MDLEWKTGLAKYISIDLNEKMCYVVKLSIIQGSKEDSRSPLSLLSVAKFKEIAFR